MQHCFHRLTSPPRPFPAAVNAAKDLDGGEAAVVGAALPHLGPLQRLGPDRAGAEHGQSAPDQEEQQDVPHRVLQVSNVDVRTSYPILTALIMVLSG